MNDLSIEILGFLIGWFIVAPVSACLVGIFDAQVIKRFWPSKSTYKSLEEWGWNRLNDKSCPMYYDFQYNTARDD